MLVDGKNVLDVWEGRIESFYDESSGPGPGGEDHGDRGRNEVSGGRRTEGDSVDDGVVRGE